MKNHQTICWEQEEDRLIRQLVNKHGLKKWNMIANKLNMQASLNTKDRTGKQCRERWHNHLDPSINKNPWTLHEENQMFTYHQQFGNKWSQISRYLPGRTDNNIKNHFYSTLRRSLRRLNKLLGCRNSTLQIKSIKPHVLSQIVNSPNIDMQQFHPFMFSFRSHKPNKIYKVSNQVHTQQVKRILSTIIHLNNRYNQQKQQTNPNNNEVTICDQETKTSLDEQQQYKPKFIPTLIQPIKNNQQFEIDSNHKKHAISNIANNVLIKSVDSPFNYHKQYI